MGMRDIEAGILREVKQVAKDTSIRQKDIMEWSTTEVKAHDGEMAYHLPSLGVWCAVLNKDKRK
jgi:hypothetical protein